MADEKRGTVRITLDLNRDLYEKLDEFCQNKGVTKAEVLRIAARVMIADGELGNLGYFDENGKLTHRIFLPI